ncbi:hypothetical protein ACJMK2_025651 [Sinanodonta woodiana]|uniref:RING-type domain-containing protein n=1 Tax=Sinanodonta woodiana TaxID=1069815 RepID=A0ABD3XJ18_SINWO
MTVVPTKACKPMIEQLGNILIASVNAKYCGYPVATPYWKDYDGVSNTNEPMLKLIPGMEAKEYYACIKSAALTCVENVMSHDYCTTFKPEGSKSPPASLETCNANALIAVCIILGISLIAIVAIAVTFIRYRLRKKNMNEEQATMLLETSRLWRKWKKYFGKLNWEDIIALLNDDQRNGLKTYCDNLIIQNNTHRRENERQDDVGNDREEASTEQQICNDPKKIKELLELRDAILCKICLLRKMNVFFLPCTHMATCTECSSSLPHCPVCRAEIKQKLTICFD